MTAILKTTKSEWTIDEVLPLGSALQQGKDNHSYVAMSPKKGEEGDEV